MRNELKFVITEGDYETLALRLKPVMPFDKNTDIDGFYRVSSLYFDDIYRTAYSQKLSGAEHRAKFRIRCYNNDGSYIALECKVKHDSYLTKESARISKDEYLRIISGDYSFLAARDEPVIREFYKQICISRLKPVVIVDYRRQVFTYNSGNVRFTFDRGIQASSANFNMLDKSSVYFFTQDTGMTVFELKYDDFLPSALNALLTGVTLVKQPVSKYVMCLDKIMEVYHHA